MAEERANPVRDVVAQFRAFFDSLSLARRIILFTVVAVVLAVPLGLLLVKVFSSANTYYYTGPFGQVSSSEMAVPIWGLVALSLGLPLVIGILTTLSVRSAPVTPPRRPT